MTPGPSFEVDHGRYLVDAEHRDQVHAGFAGALVAGTGSAVVLHEDDYGCCARESWATTERRIHVALGLIRVLRVTGPSADRRGGDS